MQYERPGDFLCGNNGPKQQRKWKPKTSVDPSTLPSMFAAAARLSTSAPKNGNKRKPATRLSRPPPDQSKVELTVGPNVPSMFQFSTSSEKTSTKEVNPKTPADSEPTITTVKTTSPVLVQKPVPPVVESLVKTSKPLKTSTSSRVSTTRTKPSLLKPLPKPTTTKVPSKEEYNIALKKNPELESEIEKQERLLRDARRLQQAAKEAEEARKQAEEDERRKAVIEAEDARKKAEEVKRIQEIQCKREALRRAGEKQARLKKEEEAARKKEEAALKAEEARRRSKAEETRKRAEAKAAEERDRENRERQNPLKHIRSSEGRPRERTPLNLPDELPDVIDGDEVLRMLNMVNKEAENDLVSIASVDTTSTSNSELSGWDKIMKDKLDHFMGSSHALPDNYCSDSESSDSDSDDEY